MKTIVWVLRCLIWTAVTLFIGVFGLLVANLRIAYGVIEMAVEVWAEGPGKD